MSTLLSDSRTTATAFRFAFVSYLAIILRWSRFLQRSDSAYSYTFLRSGVRQSSVCRLSSVTFVHLLEPFDGFRCNFAGILAGSPTHGVRSGSLTPQG